MTAYLDTPFDYRSPGMASIFDEVSFWCSRFGKLIIDRLELKPGISILDLGCGNGFPLFELANIHGPSCKLVGADPWRDALDRAALKLRTYQLGNVSLVETDGARLPFPDRSFDLITSNLGINNFIDPPAVFAECGRVVKSGGRCVVTSNIRGHMGEFYDIYRSVLKDFGNPVYLERLEANEAHRYTSESVCALLEQSGLKVTRAEEDPFFMRYVNGTAFFNHWLSRTGFLAGWKDVVDAADRDSIFGQLESRLNQLAALHGELRMTIVRLFVAASSR